MRTRKADNPKSPPATKRTPPARKSATKTPPTPPDTSQQSPSEPTVTPKRASVTRGKGVATNDTTPTTPETPVSAIKPQDDTAKVTSGTKSGSKRTVKRVVKKSVIRKKTKSADSKAQPESVAVEKEDNEPLTGKYSLKEQESSPSDAKISAKKEEDADDVCMPLKDDEDTMKDLEEGTDVKPSVESSDVRDIPNTIDHQEPEVDEKENIETEEKENKETIDDISLKIQEPFIEARIEEEEEPEEEPEEEEPEEEPEVEQLIENQETIMEKEKKVEIEEEPMECYDDEAEQLIENQETITEKEKKVEIEEEPMECYDDEVDMEKDTNDEVKGEEDLQERVCLSDEEKDNDNDIDNDAQEEDEKSVQETQQQQEHDRLGLEEEQAECKVAVEERKRRKEFEIFVGGLDRNATEEEVKKAFQYVGEVVDIRMHKELPTNKNRGYAFVRFANKEQVARALAEMKNPVIHGKRCGTAPSEDNDTLFLGNICNTWTKEAIRQKLKDYSVEGLEKITLVSDTQHEGLSRGFAFLEFSGHPDAMLAYKRLQKPDAIFGHPERSVKVAFAEPLREPDPEVLKEVKSVFVDGLPPHWDEDTLREHLKGYGSVEKIMLARNMSTAKRKDFGFVDFGTHEAALACIEGLNKRELGDEKIKLKARLSNPSPKTQAVKGGIAGGFRFGHGSGALFPRAGRGFGRGSYSNNRMEFQRGGRGGFYQHGRGQHGQTSRMGGYEDDFPPAGPHPSFRGRHNFGRGGRWNNFRGPHPHQQSQGAMPPPRYDYDRPMHDHHHHHHPMPMRGPPFMPEEEFNRPYGGPHYQDPYMYVHTDTSRGVKRSYYPYQDPEYMEPSRGRPRLDYSESASSAHGSRLRGGGSGMHSHDYYNYDYDGSYSSYYGGDRPYGGRYYY